MPTEVVLFSSCWLELAMTGLVTALVANFRLSSTQGHVLCAAALDAAAAGRREILRASCAASDSGWARLLRAALREAVSDMPEEQAGYRDAPQRKLSDALNSVFFVELARIGRSRAIGVSGAAASFLGSAMLLPAQSILMSLLMLGALASGWRVVVNGRRATAALRDASNAIPDLLAKLPPPTPPAALAVQPAPSRVPVRTSGGLLTGLFFVGLGLIVVILGAGLISEMLQRVPASKIGLLFGVHVMLMPIVLMLSFLLPNVHAAIDVAHAEVVLVHRILWIQVARTVVPLEIVGRFFVDSVDGARSRRHYLAVDTAARHRPGRRPTVEQRVVLCRGDRADEAAAVLNRALGLR